MSMERWPDVLIVAIGAYFVFCSVWARDFVLYRLKARGVANVFGESAAHRFYTALGVILIVAGIAKAVVVF